MDMLSAFDSAATKFPAKPALISCGTGPDDTAISYAELAESSRRAATVLAGRGIGPGDRVALMCYNTTGFVVAMLGTWRLGATVVPVNHKLAPPEVRYILDHSGASAIVIDGSLHAVLDAAGITTLTTDTAVDGIADFDAEVASAAPIPVSTERLPEDTIAEILYTSGTTGRPKGCVHTQRTVTLTAMTTVIGLSITREDRLLLTVPIWHASPLNNWLLGTLYAGGTVVLVREHKPIDFLSAAQKHRTTLCFGPPIVFTSALAVPDFADYDLSATRVWMYGGGPIGADMSRRLAENFHSDNFFQVYGMTETGPVGTVLYPEEQISKAGSIGRVALPGADMKVITDAGVEAKAGDVGEIWIRTESTMTGYLDNPEATAAALDADGWYHTGDLARVDDDGYLFIVDRSKDMIVTGGENVYSKEVEDALTAHPAIVEAAVLGRPHPEWGHTVVAHIVRSDGGDELPEELKEFLLGRLARYKVPREFHVTGELPHTPTGKVQKHLIVTPDPA